MTGEKEERKAFTEEETAILIELYSSELIQLRFKSTLKGHSRIWGDLGQEMTRRGFPRNGCQVKDKILNLKRRYMEVKRGMRSGDSPPDWRFWQPLHQIYGEKPSATPVAQLDSLAPQPDMDGGAGTSGSGISSPVLGGATGTPRSKRRCSSLDSEMLRLIETGQEEDRERLRRMEEREERILRNMEKLTASVDALVRSRLNIHSHYPIPYLNHSSLPQTSQSMFYPYQNPSASMPSLSITDPQPTSFPVSPQLSSPGPVTHPYPIPSPQPSPMPTPKSSQIPKPSRTSLSQPSPIPTATPVPQQSPIPTATPVPQPSPIPTATPVPQPSPIRTAIAVPQPSPIPPPQPSPIPSATPVPQATPIPTATPVPQPSPIPTAIAVPQPSPIPPPQPPPIPPPQLSPIPPPKSTLPQSSSTPAHQGIHGSLLKVKLSDGRVVPLDSLKKFIMLKNRK